MRCYKLTTESQYYRIKTDLFFQNSPMLSVQVSPLLQQNLQIKHKSINMCNSLQTLEIFLIIALTFLVYHLNVTGFFLIRVI